MAYVTVVYEGIPKTSYALWIHYYILVAFIFDVVVMIIVAVTHCVEHGFMTPASEEDGGDGKKRPSIQQKPVIEPTDDADEKAAKLEQIRDWNENLKDWKESQKEDEEERESTIRWLVTVSRIAIPLLFVVAEVFLFVVVFNYNSFEFSGTTA